LTLSLSPPLSKPGAVLPTLNAAPGGNHDMIIITRTGDSDHQIQGDLPEPRRAVKKPMAFKIMDAAMQLFLDACCEITFLHSRGEKETTEP
jgi:hypothetical protein